MSTELYWRLPKIKLSDEKLLFKILGKFLGAQTSLFLLFYAISAADHQRSIHRRLQYFFLAIVLCILQAVFVLSGL